MADSLYTTTTIRADYDRVRRLALLNRVFNWLLRRDNTLLPLDTADRLLPYHARHDAGIQLVRISQIVGSAGRAHDFDRAFLPLRSDTMQRWLNIDRAYYEGLSLPPVELVKVGDVYFVADGHHRVSVAKFWKQEFIEAHVVEIATPNPVRRVEDITCWEDNSCPVPQLAAS